MRLKFFAYHIGVHGDLGRKINKRLRANEAALSAAGIFCPVPRNYRVFLREYIWRETAGIADQPEALAAFDCPQHYQGISLSNDQALGARKAVLERGEFLFWAERRVKMLGQLFGNHRVMFMLEVENFATFLPRLIPDLPPGALDEIDTWGLSDFSWVDLVHGLSSTCPNAEFVIVPTETIATTLSDAVAKLTVGAGLPKPSSPAQISKEKIEAFQLAIGARMSKPLIPEIAQPLEDILGWDEAARIQLSRQYYSEILALYQEHTVLL